MIQLCLEMFLTKLGHRRTLDALCPFLGAEPTPAMLAIFECGDACSSVESLV